MEKRRRSRGDDRNIKRSGPPPVSIRAIPAPGVPLAVAGRGAVVVSVRYEVDEAQQAAFLAAMEPMRRSRLRSGVTRWDLYQVGEDARQFVEQFEVASWQEHQRQHEERLTGEDRSIEEAAFAHIVGRPQPHHLLPAERTEPGLHLARTLSCRGAARPV